MSHTIKPSLLLLALGATLAFACNKVVDNPQDGTTDDELAGEDCPSEGATEACGEDGTGVRACEVGEDGLLAWSDCIASACSQGETEPCGDGGMRTCVVDEIGVGTWGECQISGSSATTPLVLAFGAGPVSFSDAAGGFDLNPTMSVVTDWVSSATPWLALDRNGNGAIDDGSELFGSATELASGARATNGFQALAELDENGDGVISSADGRFGSLVAWTDLDQDRVSDPGELTTIASLGVESISLGYSSVVRCDERNNCERETASMAFRNTSGEPISGRVVDVHLAHR
ncbi:MAG: calcium-binding protein [Myxococcales bacterium]|nr:calcium-binding protein [Myxococcales bacterium]